MGEPQGGRGRVGQEGTSGRQMDWGGQAWGRGTGVDGDVQDQMDESRRDCRGAAFPLPPTVSSAPTAPPHRFWFRLYWFPLKVLYATCHCSLRSVPDIPFYFFFNALLLLLTLMNLYWFLVSRQPTAPRPLPHPQLEVLS